MKVNKILIVKPSALGDIIHTIPIVAAIKKFYGAEVHWLVSRSFKNILEHTPVVDNIYIFERKKWGGLGFFKHFGEIKTLIRKIQKEKFDLVLDFQGLLRSALIVGLSGCPTRLGFRNARECAPFFYTKKIVVPLNIVHAIDRYKLFAYELGIEKVEMNFPIDINTGIKNKWDKILPSKYVVIVPGARWTSKRWPPQYFAKLTELIYEQYKIPSVIIGAAHESKIGEEIVAQNSATNINLIGKTSLIELTYILKNANAVVSNDSGPMHLSAALNTKTIAIFGPTDPQKIGPYGNKHQVIKRKNICLCYYEKSCSQDLKCLRSIKPTEILPLLGLRDVHTRKG